MRRDSIRTRRGALFTEVALDLHRLLPRSSRSLRMSGDMLQAGAAVFRLSRCSRGCSDSAEFVAGNPAITGCTADAFFFEWGAPVAKHKVPTARSLISGSPVGTAPIVPGHTDLGADREHGLVEGLHAAQYMTNLECGVRIYTYPTAPSATSSSRTRTGSGGRAFTAERSSGRRMRPIAEEVQRAQPAKPHVNHFSTETAFSARRKYPATNLRFRSQQRQRSSTAGTGKRQLRRAKMMIRELFQAIPRSVRSLIVPRYRPERHYMRGFGPACAARPLAQH